jgi:hypothetical protein
MVFAPFVLAIYAELVRRGSLGSPMDAGQPELLGLPAGAWFQLSLLVWATVGAWIMWTTHSRLTSALAMFLFTLPSLVGLVMGPAIILILQNHGA